MRAAWYERKGPVRDVLVVGDMPTPEPGPGEVRVHLRTSGINPGDTKKRAGWLGFPMSDPRVIPHSDGVGTIDAVGPGVSPERVGQRVWVFNAQSYRLGGGDTRRDRHHHTLPRTGAVASSRRATFSARRHRRRARARRVRESGRACAARPAAVR